VALEVDLTKVDLGEVGPQNAEAQFSIRAKSKFGCPFIESNCGCLVGLRELSTQDDHGWWTIPVRYAFGTSSGRALKVIHVREQGTSESADIQVFADVQPVISLGYSGILSWRTDEKSRREQVVSLDFPGNVAVERVKIAQPKDGDAQFVATVKKITADGSAWTVVVKPRRIPLSQTMLPESLGIAVISNSPRLGKIIWISAMVIPPDPVSNE